MRLSTFHTASIRECRLAFMSPGPNGPESQPVIPDVKAEVTPKAESKAEIKTETRADVKNVAEKQLETSKAELTAAKTDIQKTAIASGIPPNAEKSAVDKLAAAPDLKDAKGKMEAATGKESLAKAMVEAKVTAKGEGKTASVLKGGFRPNQSIDSSESQKPASERPTRTLTDAELQNLFPFDSKDGAKAITASFPGVSVGGIARTDRETSYDLSKATPETRKAFIDAAKSRPDLTVVSGTDNDVHIIPTKNLNRWYATNSPIRAALDAQNQKPRNTTAEKPAGNVTDAAPAKPGETGRVVPESFEKTYPNISTIRTKELDGYRFTLEPNGDRKVFEKLQADLQGRGLRVNVNGDTITVGRATEKGPAKPQEKATKKPAGQAPEKGQETAPDKMSSRADRLTAELQKRVLMDKYRNDLEGNARFVGTIVDRVQGTDEIKLTHEDPAIAKKIYEDAVKNGYSAKLEGTVVTVTTPDGGAPSKPSAKSAEKPDKKSADTVPAPEKKRIWGTGARRAAPAEKGADKVPSGRKDVKEEKPADKPVEQKKGSAESKEFRDRSVDVSDPKSVEDHLNNRFTNGFGKQYEGIKIETSMKDSAGNYVPGTMDYTISMGTATPEAFQKMARYAEQHGLLVQPSVKEIEQGKGGITSVRITMASWDGLKDGYVGPEGMKKPVAEGPRMKSGGPSKSTDAPATIVGLPKTEKPKGNVGAKLPTPEKPAGELKPTDEPKGNADGPAKKPKAVKPEPKATEKPTGNVKGPAKMPAPEKPKGEPKPTDEPKGKAEGPAKKEAPVKPVDKPEDKTPEKGKEEDKKAPEKGKEEDKKAPEKGKEGNKKTPEGKEDAEKKESSADRSARIEKETREQLDKMDSEKKGEGKGKEKGPKTEPAKPGEEPKEVDKVDADKRNTEELKKSLRAELRNGEKPKTVQEATKEREEGFTKVSAEMMKTIDEQDKRVDAAQQTVVTLEKQLRDAKQDAANSGSVEDTSNVETIQKNLDEANANLRTEKKNVETLHENLKTTREQKEKEVKTLDQMKTETEAIAKRTEGKIKDVANNLIDANQPLLGEAAKGITVKHDGALGMKVEIAMLQPLIFGLSALIGPEAAAKIAELDNPVPILQGLEATLKAAQTLKENDKQKSDQKPASPPRRPGSPRGGVIA